MTGISNEGMNLSQINAQVAPKSQGVPANPVPASAPTAKGDSVSIENFFANFADKVKTMFSGSEGPTGSSEMKVAEFSMQMSVKETFEASYTSTGNGAKVSAYMQQTKEVNVRMSFKMAQADQVAQAHMNAMQGDPFSPEATASRIADFALGFFPMFAADHPEMSHEEQVDAFQEMVEGAISEGFNEALAILGNMPDEVMGKLNETMDIVESKLSSFFDNLRGDGAEAGKAAVENGTFQDYIDEFFNPKTEDDPLTT